MKNTLEGANFRIVIYRQKDSYIGICYEIGWVEEGDTEEEVKKHLFDGIIALMKTIADAKVNEKTINQKPPIKYRFIFYWFALLSIFRLPFVPDVTFLREPISPNSFMNT